MFKRFTLVIICIIFIQISYAQEVEVVNSKGTKVIARNNQVTLSSTTPTSPVIADVWFDNTDANNVITKIFDGTNWVLVNTKVKLLQDDDGDTTITVEKNNDEDIIRFSTGDTNTNRQLLRIKNPGLFSNISTKSAILGLEANESNNFDGRLRISAGNDDTFDDSQGASIDLHGNSTTANTGRVDLIAGANASGNNLAFTVWGNNGASTPLSSARIVMTGKGNVGIGNSSPNTEAILDLTNTQKLAFLLPTETEASEIVTPTNGMLLYSSTNKNAYLRADNSWKPIAYNSVSNELIFDGDNDADTTNDNYRYISLVVNGNWKVIRYDKTDVNIEDSATATTNPGQVNQPTTLAECSALTF
jgi:hypothetical protein